MEQKINITLEEIIKITNGSYRGPIESLKKKISSLTIDSRTSKQSDLYIAIEGKKHDGNQFTKDVLEKGVKFAIISNSNFQSDRTILVKNSKEALASIALYLRNQIKPKVIAITGSNGKTSTKEILVSIMSKYLTADQFLFTEGNFNNEIGLPLTLLNLKKKHSYAVLELGMNHAGEIAELAKIAKPHIALITNIGEAHIENFKSKDDIAKAKRELLVHSDQLEICVLPKDDDYYKFLSKSKKYLREITFGFESDATIKYEILDNKKIKIFTPKGNFDVRINLLGKHNLMNILAACACSYALEIPVNIMKKGIESIKPFPGRLETLKGINGATVINDSYNANPSSMMEAIEVLASMDGHKILVIGDMAELGNNTDRYHKDLGRHIKASQIDITLAVGRHTKITMQQLDKKELWFDSKNTLMAELLKVMDYKSTVLVKGSRFMKMEDIVNKIIL